MQSPLNSTDLIKLSSDHRKNIGKDKATYMEGVLFGYLIKSQVPCMWEQKEVRNTSVVYGFIYTKGCNGSTETGSLSLKNTKTIMFCNGCGHKIEIVKEQEDDSI